MVITGSLDFFTTSKSGEIEESFASARPVLLFASLLRRLAGGASGVQVVPVITAAAPMAGCA